MCFFSIIIPTYNRRQVLQIAIKSVLAQSFTDYELIIIDDGSTDKTVDQLGVYLSIESVSYYYKENAGVCAARNYGASVAKGRYLLFLDSDDTVAASWLSDFAALLQSKSLNLVFCSINELLPEGKARIKHARDDRNGGNYIPGSFCISKELFLQAGGYDDAIHYGENTELSFRLSGFALQVGYVERANLVYKASADGGSKNWKNKLESTLYILEKHTEIFQKNKRVKSFYYSVAGLAAFKCKQLDFARLLFLRSFLANPLNWKAIIRLVVSLFSPLAKRVWK